MSKVPFDRPRYIEIPAKAWFAIERSDNELDAYTKDRIVWPYRAVIFDSVASDVAKTLAVLVPQMRPGHNRPSLAIVRTVMEWQGLENA
jgi:hypothetical protein